MAGVIAIFILADVMPKVGADVMLKVVADVITS